ncbi:MAG: hypothetical protein HYV32_02530 [Candidatus Kerfeldbacteria bacterium]|nr:hypothetical protein [Candidatus Kerfeldbacteria bacterium]
MRIERLMDVALTIHPVSGRLYWFILEEDCEYDTRLTVLDAKSCKTVLMLHGAMDIPLQQLVVHRW